MRNPTRLWKVGVAVVLALFVLILGAREAGLAQGFAESLAAVSSSLSEDEAVNASSESQAPSYDATILSSDSVDSTRLTTLEGGLVEPGIGNAHGLSLVAVTGWAGVFAILTLTGVYTYRRKENAG